MREGAPDTMSRLATDAGVRLHRSHGVDLVAVEDAHRFLDGCEAHGIRVLGGDGLFLRGDEIRPQLDRIADFSSVTDPAASVTEARQFLDRAAVADLVVEFTLDVDD